MTATAAELLEHAPPPGNRTGVHLHGLAGRLMSVLVDAFYAEIRFTAHAARRVGRPM